MAKVISKTYGEALFELAVEQNKLAEIAEQATVLSQAFAENPELAQLLTHPKITKEEKKAVIENCFKGRLDDDLVGFLLIVVDKDRAAELTSIFEYFHAKVREYNKVGVALVTSAVELTADQKKQVEQKLLEQTEYESFQTKFMVDPALIGGMIIRIGDRVVDSSIRTKLANMTKELRKISLV